MNICGKAIIPVKVGNLSENIEFIVASNISPRIILGIVALKRMKIDLCASQSCVFVENTKIPFMSKVEESAKNGQESCFRVGARLNKDLQPSMI